MVRYVEKHELRDGRILLYVDGDKIKPIWNCRFRLPGKTGYVLKSSGTTNLAEATRFADELYDELRLKIKFNMPIKDKTFNEVIDEWLEKGIANLSIHRQKLHKSIGLRYFKAFFGSLDVVRINDQKIDEYWEWRLSYWKSGPGALSRPSNAVDTPAQKTLDMEKGMLAQILRWAKRRGYLANLPIVERHKLPGRRSKEEKRRPDFSQEDMNKLIEFMKGWIKSGRNAYHNYYRELLYHAIMVIYWSGVRPNELRQLRWCDISYNEYQALTFHIAPTTKTGERKCVPMPEVIRHLNALRELTGVDDDSDPTSVIFVGQDGKPITWTAFGTVKSLLQDAGVLTDSFGRERTLYSFRHTYATQRLLSDTSIQILSKNLGTSVHYIEQHYDHTTNLMNAEALTKNSTQSVREMVAEGVSDGIWNAALKKHYKDKPKPK